MPFHDWRSKVIGGVLAPRFVLCDSTNLITNGEFEEGTTGWSTGAQTADALTPFGDYALKITSASEITCDPSDGALGGKTYLVSVYARGTLTEEDLIVYASSPTETYTTAMENLSSTEFSQYFAVVTWAAGQTGTTFKVKFNPSGDLYIDRVRCYTVEHDITAMPVASDEDIEFPQELQARVVRSDYTITDYVAGWRFRAELDYDLLTAKQERWRTMISEADIVLFQPHIDALFNIMCRWDEKRYKRRFFHKRYLGHSGAIELIGVDLLSAKPVEIVS